MGMTQILDFAIAQEEEAAALYAGLAERVESPAMKKVFEDFAREELGHKVHLESIKKGGRLSASVSGVPDLRIADYLVEIDPAVDPLDYQNALIIAMKNEKAAFRMYSDMAAGVADPALRDLFLGLAQEEARHKLRFEIEYDERILADN